MCLAAKVLEIVGRTTCYCIYLQRHEYLYAKSKKFCKPLQVPARPEIIYDSKIICQKNICTHRWRRSNSINTIFSIHSSIGQLFFFFQSSIISRLLNIKSKSKMKILFRQMQHIYFTMERICMQRNEIFDDSEKKARGL